MARAWRHRGREGGSGSGDGSGGSGILWRQPAPPYQGTHTHRRGNQVWLHHRALTAAAAARRTPSVLLSPRAAAAAHERARVSSRSSHVPLLPLVCGRRRRTLVDRQLRIPAALELRVSGVGFEGLGLGLRHVSLCPRHVIRFIVNRRFLSQMASAPVTWRDSVISRHALTS
jgi:hypothetical protein